MKVPRESWLLRYALGSAQRAATWHVAMLEREGSLHDPGDWRKCQNASCVANREFVEAFERYGVPTDEVVRPEG